MKPLKNFTEKEIFLKNVWCRFLTNWNKRTKIKLCVALKWAFTGAFTEQWRNYDSVIAPHTGHGFVPSIEVEAFIWNSVVADKVNDVGCILP